MAILLAFPVLSILLMVQSAILSHIMLLRGTADLVLLALIAWALQKRVQTAWHWSIIGGLMVGLVSSLPLPVALIGYPLATGLALFLRQRVLQAPVLSMFVGTFAGTLITHLLTIIGLRLAGNPMPFLEALNLITLPSLLMNMLLAIPIFAMIGDLASWVYPEELEV